MRIYGPKTSVEEDLLEVLRKIYEMTKNTKKLPIHGKSKIAILARRAIMEVTGKSP